MPKMSYLRLRYVSPRGFFRTHQRQPEPNLASAFTEATDIRHGVGAQVCYFEVVASCLSPVLSVLRIQFHGVQAPDCATITPTSLTHSLTHSLDHSTTSTVKIDVYDYDDSTSHDLIGSCTATVAELSRVRLLKDLDGPAETLSFAPAHAAQARSLAHLFGRLARLSHSDILQQKQSTGERTTRTAVF